MTNRRLMTLAVATVCLALIPLSASAQPAAPHLIQATHVVAPTHPQATDTNNPTGAGSAKTGTVVLLVQQARPNP